MQIIYKIIHLKNIDFIYKKFNILIFNDLKKVYMLNYMCKEFLKNVPNIVQVKCIRIEF